MKKLLLFLTLVIGSTFMSAQTVVWSDDFEDLDISDWTLYDEDGDGRNWGDIFYIEDQNNNQVTITGIVSRSWQGSALTPDNWAVSPAIDLSNASGQVSLKWVTEVASESWDEENYSVYVGTSSDIADLVDSTVTLTQTLGDDDNTGTPVNHSLDISSFAGEAEVYVAFRHHDVTDMDFIVVDDVTVEAENVLSVSDLSVKSTTIYPNPVKDVFQVKLSSKFNAENVTVTIIDITGKKVQTFTGVSNYNVSKLPAGVYVVNITDGVNTKTEKLIIK